MTELLKAGVHFGHQPTNWHPKMKPHIFGERGGIHIIDLDATQRQLVKALDFVKGVAERGGTILFVGTKRQAQDVVKAAAESCNMPYVNGRWLGGTLTNFPQIRITIRRLKTLRDEREKGEWKKYTKLEQLLLSREVQEMEEKLGGIQHLEKMPDVIFLTDVYNEKTAVAEATSSHLPIVALCDSNVNPRGITYVIPGNDDGVQSITLITHLVAEAIREGAAAATQQQPVAAKNA